MVFAIRTSAYILAVLAFMLCSTYGQECPNECSGHGTCANGKCFCFRGYFDTPEDDIKDCTTGLVPKFEVAWDVCRSIFAAIFFALFIVSALGTYEGIRRHRNDESMAAIINLRPWVLSIIAISSLSQGLFLAIDPNGFYGIAGVTANYLMHGASYYLILGGYVSVLFHWIDLYNVSISSLRKEQMLLNINANYRGKSLTVEDMAAKVKFLYKLRIPFLVTIGILIVFQFTYSIMSGVGLNGYFLFLGFYAYLGLNWAILSVGFLAYGRKLLSIMPGILFKKVRQLTFKITTLSIIMLVCFFIVLPASLIIGSYGIGEYEFAEFFIVEGILAFESAGLVVVIGKVQKKFPFIFGSQSKSSGSRQETQASGEQMSSAIYVQ